MHETATTKVGVAVLDNMDRDGPLPGAGALCAGRP